MSIVSSIAVVLTLFLAAVGMTILLFRLMFKDYNNQ